MQPFLLLFSPSYEKIARCLISSEDNTIVKPKIKFRILNKLGLEIENYKEDKK
jgi:hypothetical protein